MHDKILKHKANLPGAEHYILVKPYTMKELCTLYGMSYRIMKAFINPLADKIGPVVGRMFNVRQVEIIFEHIGVPYAIKDI